MLDVSTVVVNDDFEIIGLSEKFSNFVKQYPELFGDSTPPPATHGGKPHVSGSVDTDLETLQKTAKMTGHPRDIAAYMAKLREKK